MPRSKAELAVMLPNIVVAEYNGQFAGSVAFKVGEDVKRNCLLGWLIKIILITASCLLLLTHVERKSGLLLADKLEWKYILPGRVIPGNEARMKMPTAG